MNDPNGEKHPGELPPEEPAQDGGTDREQNARRHSEHEDGSGARESAGDASTGRSSGDKGGAEYEARNSREGEPAGSGERAGGEGDDHRPEQDAGVPGGAGTGRDSGDAAAPGPEPGGADAASPQPPSTPAAPGGVQPGEELTGRQRLAKAVWPPRVTRAQLIVALLLFVLGLGLAIQVRSTSENSALRGARQEDLVRILDELDDRSKRLEDEKQSLDRQRTELENSSDQAEEARKQTQQKARQLGVLAGTVGARGPGIELTISDPGGSVEADMLLDAVQELRAAGAEAIEVNDVRVVASTYFSDSAGGVSVDGHKISPPYRFQVIGKAKDLEPALNIPGGVVQTLRKEQADASVKPSQDVVVDALRAAKRPDYARSSGS